MAFNSASAVLGTSETDIVTFSGKGLTLLIQAINTTGSSVNCEIWVTNASNTHQYPLFPSQAITAYNGVSDNAKHSIASGYKIRGTAGSGSAIYVEVSYMDVT